MNVKILKIEGNVLVDAKISDSKLVKVALPSVADGWRFNFNKHAKKRGAETYVLVTEETSDKIEGSLTFEMKDKVEPYMAYIEVAPHNRGEVKEYENVAGCLIAFACRLSFTKGEGVYNGYLAFDIGEANEADETKLMAVYSTKYNAFRLGQSNSMIIPPEGGQKLIDEFLNR